MTTIITKNSSTATAVPTTSDLVQGELAVNVADKRIFTEDATTTIVELGTNPSTVTTATADVTGVLTANGTLASSNAVVTGGTIDGTPIGVTTASTVAATTLSASAGITGTLTGDVTGALTGNVTGNVTGNITGDVTGNVTAASGTTTLNNLSVSGTADFTNTVLANVATPVANADAANKLYVDTAVADVIDVAPAALDTLNELAAALGDDANFSTTITNSIATKLPLAGGTMSGAIAMGTSKVTGLGDPTGLQDAATKTYVDTADALKLPLAGGTMSGAIAMGTSKITGVGEPTLAQDVTSKSYVDGILGSATAAATSASNAATSESNASTSASNAATSETNAGTSETNAAASYDAFDDRYLGSFGTAPTVDNDGAALLTGAIYWDTATTRMEVYTGTAWQAVSPTVTSTNGSDLTVLTGDDITFADNSKAIFGAGSDLQIYHDGSNSYVREQGTGPLKLLSNGLQVKNAADDESMIVANQNGAVTLYHDNAPKLATTSTGIDVTGTATMNGLTVDGLAQISAQTNGAYALRVGDAAGSSGAVAGIGKIGINPQGAGLFTYTGTEIRATENAAGDYRAALSFHTRGDTSDVESLKRLNIANTGDISFYNTTGTSQSLFWDASTENLGIGTSSPVEKLYVNSTSGDARIGLNAPTGSDTEIKFNNNGVVQFSIGHDDGTDNFVIGADNVDAPYVSVTKAGLVGIGTSSPSEALTVASAGKIKASRSDNARSLFLFNDSNAATVESDTDPLLLKSADRIEFETGGANERMRITSAGLVGIGTDTPDGTLHVHSGSAGTIAADTDANELILESSSDSGLTVLCPDANTGRIHIGSPTDNNAFRVTWNYDAGQALVRTHKVGATVSFLADNNVTNLTLSGASGSELATFAGKVTTTGNTTINDGALYLLDSTNSTTAVVSTGNNGSIILNADLNASFANSDIQLKVDGSAALIVDDSLNASFAAKAIIGSTSVTPAGRLHVYTGNSGTAVLPAISDDFVVEGNASSGMGVIVSDGFSSNFTLGSQTTPNGFAMNWSESGSRTTIRNNKVGAQLWINTDNDVNAVKFSGASGSELATFAGTVSTDGIVFPATQVASANANTLDDYEEGTWTPVFWDGTNDQTGSSVQSATYTKIGRVVYIEMCVLNVDTTGMTAGSPVYIKGLPFTPASAGVNDKNVIGAVQCDNVTTDSGSVFLRTITSQTYARLIEQTTTGEAGLIISDITSGNADFRINGFYIAAN